MRIKYSIITPVYNRADCIMRCIKSVENALNKIEGGCPKTQYQMSEILQSVSLLDDSGLANGCNSRLSGQNTSKSSRGAFNLKVESSRNGVLGQAGGGEFEHIIVDDGSTDATVSIVEEYVKGHPHVVFVKFDHNRGTNAARNEAIRIAKGKWSVILDSDDYFVDNALQVIVNTMQKKPNYKHYMFVPDDMQGYFEKNLIIRGAAQKVLLYPDFLNGYIGGDFIHVCSTEILRKYPFDERLRIYEGVFFLMFFREAQQMLFTNNVVTIRERNRKDSVTKDVLRTSDKVIVKSVLRNETYLKNFEEDLHVLGMSRRLHLVQMNLLEDYLLLGKYEEAKELIAKIKKIKGKKGKVLKLVSSLKLGYLYKVTLKLYLILKYKI